MVVLLRTKFTLDGRKGLWDFEVLHRHLGNLCPLSRYESGKQLWVQSLTLKIVSDWGGPWPLLSIQIYVANITILNCIP